MNTDTLVHVTIGSEVSASVPQTIYNMATSTPDITFWTQITQFISSLF